MADRDKQTLNNAKLVPMASTVEPKKMTRHLSDRLWQEASSRLQSLCWLIKMSTVLAPSGREACLYREAAWSFKPISNTGRAGPHEMMASCLILPIDIYHSADLQAGWWHVDAYLLNSSLTTSPHPLLANKTSSEAAESSLCNTAGLNCFHSTCS